MRDEEFWENAFSMSREEFLKLNNDREQRFIGTAKDMGFWMDCVVIDKDIEGMCESLSQWGNLT